MPIFFNPFDWKVNVMVPVTIAFKELIASGMVTIEWLRTLGVLTIQILGHIEGAWPKSCSCHMAPSVPSQLLILPGSSFFFFSFFFSLFFFIFLSHVPEVVGLHHLEGWILGLILYIVGTCKMDLWIIPDPQDHGTITIR